MIARLALLVFAMLLPRFGAALDLTLPPAARQTFDENLGMASYALPVAPFDGASIPERVFEGFVTRGAWQIDGGDQTPLQLMQLMRDDLDASGFTPIFECAARDCGGFDFRFGTNVIAAPDMFVDLGNYRFLSALKGPSDKPTGAVSLLVSRNASAAFVQVIQVSLTRDEAVTRAGAKAPVEGTSFAVPQGSLVDLGKQLETRGHVILSDLVFDTGSSDLGNGEFESLDKIAAYLLANPKRSIALVGHTDAVGSLSGNITLSKKRAASVMARLISKFGVPEAQLSADGVGFLAPVASNLSDAGRDANRRVEAVLISVQ